MNSGETVTHCGLEWLNIPLQTVYAQCLWWEGWILHDTCDIFPQRELPAITLVGGGGLEMEGLELEPGVRQGSPLLSGHYYPTRGGV